MVSFVTCDSMNPLLPEQFLISSAPSSTRFMLLTDIIPVGNSVHNAIKVLKNKQSNIRNIFLDQENKCLKSSSKYSHSLYYYLWSQDHALQNG